MNHRPGMIVAATVFSILFASGIADAGGKPDGARCHVSKSCESKLCVRQNPLDKFGVCCDPVDCAEANAQCGSIDNGCGVPTDCGTCGFGFDCVANQCVPGTTTTTSSTTTTTDSVTTTTAGGCQDQTCNSPAACASPNFCFTFQTPENTCGECAGVVLCESVQQCTSSSQCGPEEVCVINSCCPTGVCSPRCEAPASTTTTLAPTTTTSPPTTSTTLSPTTTTAPPTTTTLVPCENATGPACAGECASSTAECVEWQPGVCLCLD